jgi:tetratricopeptide (TPR) repeat protein
MCDYIKDGAVGVGNATPEESQFVTSVVNGELHTEQVVRHGSTTGQNARAMTQRELDQERERREKAATMAVSMAEDMIKIVDKDGKEIVKKELVTPTDPAEEVIEEVYTSMSKSDINAIVAECEQNKTRGNEAFAAGEYGQALLLYTLALDKADELPDKDVPGERQLFPRHIVLANRSAAFLKLGDHEKALNDASKAQNLNPAYVKGIFRRGLALHAMGRHQRSEIEALAAAYKLEPKNKQIKEALQFAEVRMTQEMRKRMGES